MKHLKMPVLVALSMLACVGLAACGNTSLDKESVASSVESSTTSSVSQVSSSDVSSASVEAEKTSRIEAEDAVLKGASVTAVEEAGSNASNGKHVGNLYDGEMRWYVDSSKTATGELTFSLATADADITSFNDWFMVSVNDEVVMPKNTQLTRAGDGWWAWYTYDFNQISLVEGLNRITLAGLSTSASNTNFDYIEIKSAAEVTNHIFAETDNKDYIFNGNDATLFNCSMASETDHNAWRNVHVGGIGEGSKIIYSIHTEAAQTVDLAARVALVTSNDFNAMYSVKVNDADLTIADGTISAEASTAWDSYHLKELGSVALKAGDNTIAFTVKDLPTNFDFLRVSSANEITKSEEEDVDVTGDSYYLEAESGTIVGFNTENNDSAHGGKDVGGVNAGNGSITFSFTAAEATEVSFYISYARSVGFVSTATLTLNDTALTIPSSFKDSGGWGTFEEAKLTNAEVVNGANTLVFANAGGDFGNVDYIRIISPKAITI